MHKDIKGATASRRAVWRPPLPVTQAFIFSFGRGGGVLGFFYWRREHHE